MSDDTAPRTPDDAGGALPRLEWDDRLWEEVWNQQLTHVQRHEISIDVLWRQRLPDDLFFARVATELARRWRRRARNYAVVYGFWTLFWGAIAWQMFVVEHPETRPTLVAPAMALCGIAAIGVCIAIRRRLDPIARLDL
jgi:hypothetical protein